jgi:PAS domain-containing protein
MTEKILQLNQIELKSLSAGNDSSLSNNPCNFSEISGHNSTKGFFWANENIYRSFKENFAVHDITGRKFAEGELQKKEMQLHTAQKIVHIGSWEIDLSSKKVGVSEEARRICGVEDGLFTLNRIRNIILPEYVTPLLVCLCGLPEL